MMMKSVAFLSLLFVTSHAFHVPNQARHKTTALSAVTAGDQDRRGFLASSMAAAASMMLPPMIQPAHADGVDYKAVAADVMDLVAKNPDYGPSKYYLALISNL